MKLLDKLSAKSLILNRVTGVPQREGESWWYPASGGSLNGNEIADTFDSYVERAYQRNGIVFACVLARMMPFSEARFQYQEIVGGNPGRLTSGPGLELLERPWPNGTTGELLARMEQDISLAGNFYAVPINGRLRRLRPDWVTIVSGVPDDEDASPFDVRSEVLAYHYQPPGRGITMFTPSRIVHYSPIPDPSAQWRGMSWLTPVINEISADTQMTGHKLRFLKRGTSLNFAIVYDKTQTAAQVKEHAAFFKAQHEGAANAYATLHIGGGADPKPLSVGLKDLDFKAVQGAGETRIAAAAGVGAIIARFSEGMQGSSLNTGNYEAAKRQFADMTLRPLWRSAAGALEKVTDPPANHRLWYDGRDVEFLKADRKDAAEIQGKRAETVNSLVTAGYTPESVIDAVEADDFSRLVHSGLYSVQLQRPITAQEVS